MELGAGVRLRLWGDIGVGVQWGGAGGGIGGWGEIESMGRYWGWGCSGGCKPIWGWGGDWGRGWVLGLGYNGG